MDKRKVVLVGTGMVGMSFAYAALNQNACDELVLIDINKERAIGEAMDLNHGLAFSRTAMKIYAGEYKDCGDADIVVICAGVNQKEGETRLDLLSRNAKVFESIINPVLESGFNGIFLVATNPVDIMTRITYDMSGFDACKVIGTGTTLDTARLRFSLGEYFGIDPRNVHAYVIGEHRDTEFVPWSQAMIGTKPVETVVSEFGDRFKREEMDAISERVKNAAYEIIEAKQSTYYGIGMSLVRIVKAILKDESSILTLSAYLDGQYGQRDVYAGVPVVVGREGIKGHLELHLTPEEEKKFAASCETLRQFYSEANL